MRCQNLRKWAVLGGAVAAFNVAVWSQTKADTPDASTQKTPVVQKQSETLRPQYRIQAALDYELLTFQNIAEITVPVAPRDALKDVVFFLYANASAAPGHKHITVDKVSLAGKPVPFKLDGAVLRVTLPQHMSTRFVLKIEYRGVVPRAPETGSGLQDMVGALGIDIGSILGGMLGGETKTNTAQGATPQTQKPKNTDYGLYTFGNEILSLGAFWYPQLAVRQNGKWVDEAPSGLGDVAFAEMSDFDVSLDLSGQRVPDLKLLASGELQNNRFVARNVREFPLLASRNFAAKTKTFDVGGKKVEVTAAVAKNHAAKLDETLEIAGRALQIFARRFGPYPYDSLKVVEGPMRGGAGGMEYSGLIVIASMLFGDMEKQLGGLGASLGLGTVDALPGDASTQESGGIFGQQKAILDSMLETTIAHEVAHQWWAIGVGSDSQRAPWQDESLTNYSAIVYYEDRYGKAKAQQMADLHLKGAYETARMLGAPDAPANKPTSAYAGNLQYGAIVYGKGALFYGELRKLLGDEVFFASLREYYDEYSNRLAPQNSLRRIFEKNAPAQKSQIAALYARWIEGTHGDEDISGGKPASLSDLLGGILNSSP
jgi:hypothetical protein